MPRIRKEIERPRQTPASLALTDRLAAELKGNAASGQPLIYEVPFASGKLQVTVIWDDWDRLPLEDRSAVILQAYSEAEGAGLRARIALATGLTVPEAHAAGMLPFEALPLPRSSDRVTLQQCQDVMVQEGATRLIDPDRPRLWFSTLQEAEAAQKRLVACLPQSASVWAIVQEAGRGED